MQPPPPGQWGGQWYGVPVAPDPRPQDDEHLRILVICHYVLAAWIALFALIPLVYVGVGAMLVHGSFFPTAPGAPAPPAALGWVFIGVGVAISAAGETMAVLTFFAARCLAARTHWLFCVVIASFNTLHAPLGTALGVFTLVVLMRQSVKATFQGAVS